MVFTTKKRSDYGLVKKPHMTKNHISNCVWFVDRRIEKVRESAKIKG